MPTSFVPIAIKGIDVSDKGQLQVAWFQLCDFVSVSLTATGIANLLNGQGLLTGSALANGTLTATQMQHTITDLGTITTDQAVNTNSSEFVFVRFISSTTQTRILTLNNLAQGAVVALVAAVTAGTLTLKVQGTDPNSNAYGVGGWLTTSGAMVNLGTVGAALTTSTFLSGMTGFATTSASPQLEMFYS